MIEYREKKTTFNSTKPYQTIRQLSYADIKCKRKKKKERAYLKKETNNYLFL